jgi:hypothetical protein
MFRFTIRELLMLTVSVALAVGWWAEYRANAERAELWQSRAERIVDLLADDGWDISWSETPGMQSVTIKTPNGVKHLSKGR